MKKDDEFTKMAEGKTCEFEHEGRKCMSKKIVGIARGRFLCKIHFKTITNDNNRRSRANQEVPEELVFTRELTGAETWSRDRNLTKRRLNNGN